MDLRPPVPVIPDEQDPHVVLGRGAEEEVAFVPLAHLRLRQHHDGVVGDVGAVGAEAGGGAGGAGGGEVEGEGAAGEGRGVGGGGRALDVEDDALGAGRGPVLVPLEPGSAGVFEGEFVVVVVEAFFCCFFREARFAGVEHLDGAGEGGVGGWREGHAVGPDGYSAAVDWGG